MMIFTVITEAVITALLLCSLSWISVSVSESQTVEAQPGEEVTLLSKNMSRHPDTVYWFRVINRTEPHCISSMYGSVGEPSFYDGFQNGKFEMSSNVSTVFLKIKPVDLSDSGLYFCGFYIKGQIVIASTTLLNIQGGDEYYDEVHNNTQKEPDGKTILMSVILGSVIVFLTVVIIVLAVKLKKAVNEEVQPQRTKNLDSDDLNYAALSFQKPKRHHRPASERELEPNVVYAATR